MVILWQNDTGRQFLRFTDDARIALVEEIMWSGKMIQASCQEISRAEALKMIDGIHTHAARAFRDMVVRLDFLGQSQREDAADEPNHI